MVTIKERLFEMQDIKYRDFQRKLIPELDPDRIIGVRTPDLRKFAKELIKTGRSAEITEKLPHEFFEENQLHTFMICEMKDYDSVIAELEKFLPYIDNWATCDQTSPKIFRSNRERLIGDIKRWLRSSETYTVRFGMEMLMLHYLDENFKPEYLELAAGIRSEEYYLKMMSAWFFSTALAKQYDEAVRYIEEDRLDAWVHNKTIQKARESRCIPQEKKEYLKALKR